MRSDEGEMVEMRVLREDLPCLVENWAGAEVRNSSAVDWIDDRSFLPIGSDLEWIWEF